MILFEELENLHIFNNPLETKKHTTLITVNLKKR